MENSVLNRFIKVHSISNKPGNPVTDCYQSVDTIMGFAVATDELTKIGVSTVIDIRSDACLYVIEHIDDIVEMLSKIPVLP